MFKETMIDFGAGEELVVVRESDGAFIPQDESNKDYQAYLQWKKAKK